MFVVTGANGFIGSAVVWELNKRGHTDIICVDPIDQNYRPDPLAGAKFSQFLKSDDLWSFLSQLKNPKSLEAIIHMGACSSTTEMDTEFLARNNTEYTQKLFQWCQDNQVLFIYASSAATYGSGELGFSDRIDSEKLKPLNPYGYSKVAVDRWVRTEKNQSTPWYGLRFFNVFGPNEGHKGPMSSLIYKAYHQVLETGELGLFKSYNPQFADGEQVRDFVYVKDVTRWICEIIDKKPPSDIYNMGYGVARTWKSVANAVFKGLAKPTKIKWLEMPENIKNQYQYFTEAEMSHWESMKMSKPQWSLEEGIEDYIKNYLLLQTNLFSAKITSKN